MKITRNINGVMEEFELTGAEMEAAFREQQRSYMIMDAESHLTELSDELEGDGSSLRKVYGISLETAIDEKSPDYLLDSVVDMYERHFDCNIDENTTWRNAVEYMLKDVKEYFIKKAVEKLEYVFAEQRDNGGYSLESILGIMSINELTDSKSDKYILDDIIEYYTVYIDEGKLAEDTAWYNACAKALDEFKSKHNI